MLLTQYRLGGMHDDEVHRLAHLLPQRVLAGQQHQQLRRRQLQQHARDLARERRVEGVNLGGMIVIIYYCCVSNGLV